MTPPPRGIGQAHPLVPGDREKRDGTEQEAAENELTGVRPSSDSLMNVKLPAGRV